MLKMCLHAFAVLTKFHRLNDLDTTEISLLPVLGPGKSKTKVLEDLMSGEVLFPGP